MIDTCPFCKSKRKSKTMYECGSLDNDPHPRTYKCALNAWYNLKEKLNAIEDVIGLNAMLDKIESNPNVTVVIK
jgi:hypothetical protein